VQDALGQLAPRFLNVAAAHDVKEALKRLNTKAHKVIVFASASIVDGERTYLEILRQDPAFHATPHYTIVTCKGTEVDTSYELCERGVFDDYVIIRPLYDPHRLPIAAHQALRLQQAMELTTGVSNALGKAGSSMDEFSAALEKQIADVRDLSSTFKTDLDRVQDGVVGRLADIGVEFIQGMGGEVSSAQIEESRRKFQELARQAIQPGLASLFGDAASALGKWTDSLELEITKGHSAMKAVIDQATELRAPVLVVDDDPVVRDVVATILEESGFHADGVGSVADALQAFSKKKYCCALVDYELPDGNGIDLISRLRSLAIYRKLPIVFMSGHSERKVVEVARAKGIRHFIVKPIQRHRIVRSLEDALAE
jgi:CheY-like chemotaxis protein